MRNRLRRIAENEANCRDRNERAQEAPGASDGGLIEFVCECGNTGCDAAMLLTDEEYEKVRGYGGRFAMLPGHVIPDTESVVETFDRYVVVQKHGEGAAAAEGRDPRHHVKTCRVLVVDDIVEVRILLKMLMQLEPTCTVVA